MPNCYCKLILIQAFILVGFYLSYPALADSTTLTVCYNFGCKSKGAVRPTNADINRLADLFSEVDSALEERTRIRLAIANMELIAARYLPTGNDIGGNYTQGMVEDGKQDCIDESTNTTSYLKFLDQQGWLHWHTVEERVHRAPYIFDDHWAAQIRERTTNEIYVVDSWYRDNGKPPVIQKLEDWKRKRDINE